jgi:hypothetical protein
MPLIRSRLLHNTSAKLKFPKCKQGRGGELEYHLVRISLPSTGAKASTPAAGASTNRTVFRQIQPICEEFVSAIWPLEIRSIDMDCYLCSAPDQKFGANSTSKWRFSAVEVVPIRDRESSLILFTNDLLPIQRQKKAKVDVID